MTRMIPAPTPEATRFSAYIPPSPPVLLPAGYGPPPPIAYGPPPPPAPPPVAYGPPPPPSPPPLAYAPPPPPFSAPPRTLWSRRSTWIVLAVCMLALAIAYFLSTAAGSLASAPGGCGGG